MPDSLSEPGTFNLFYTASGLEKNFTGSGKLISVPPLANN